MFNGREGRTSEIEATGEGAPTARDGADEVRLVPAPARACGLGRARSHLLLLDLEDGREAGRGGATAGVAVEVCSGALLLLLLLGCEGVGLCVEGGGLGSVDRVVMDGAAWRRATREGG